MTWVNDCKPVCVKEKGWLEAAGGSCTVIVLYQRHKKIGVMSHTPSLKGIHLSGLVRLVTREMMPLLHSDTANAELILAGNATIDDFEMDDTTVEEMNDMRTQLVIILRKRCPQLRITQHWAPHNSSFHYALNVATGIFEKSYVNIFEVLHEFAA